MKLSALLMFFAVFALQANTTYSQKTKVSLNLINVPVGQVIEEIESKTDFKFVYRIKDVNLKRIITVKANKKLVTSVLENIFSSTNTSYKILDTQIFLVEKDGVEDSNVKEVASIVEVEAIQQTEIKGVVSDAQGPLPGVSILVKGTTTGTETDFEGNFSIEVEQGATLSFTFIGMVPG